MSVGAILIICNVERGCKARIQLFNTALSTNCMTFACGFVASAFFRSFRRPCTLDASTVIPHSLTEQNVLEDLL